MSDEQTQADVPFSKVVDLCERHGFRLMRIVDGVRVFWIPGKLDRCDPLTWLAIEVQPSHCVRRTIYRRLQQFFRDFRDEKRSGRSDDPTEKPARPD